MKFWLEKARVALANMKTKAALITNRIKKNTAKIEIGEHMIKYISKRDNWRQASQKWVGATTALAVMIKNVATLNYIRRLLTAGTVQDERNLNEALKSNMSREDAIGEMLKSKKNL